jgi:hypothetical protein
MEKPTIFHGWDCARWAAGVSTAKAGVAQPQQRGFRAETPPAGAAPRRAAPPERTSALDQATAPRSGSERARRAPTPLGARDAAHAACLLRRLHDELRGA